MKNRHIPGVETFLKSREARCMNACSRFINREAAKSAVWIFHDREEQISALIIHSRQSLLPVSGALFPPPHFLSGPFGTPQVHSLQGRKQDVLVLESALEKTGRIAADIIDYDLMGIERAPSDYLAAGPAGLVIRGPEPADMDTLVKLHAAYEQEEVLPAASTFNPAASRMNIERIYAKEQMLVAELSGRLVGKINTNAVAFTRYQIGGVYVHPDYRGLGIARRMAGEFTSGLIKQGKGISLFVKKSNPAACRVYQRIGFETLGDYRISYY
jgi:ribosomal protein S18 acetylase RimI-like enzyme